jgi:hypothetical protein
VQNRFLFDERRRRENQKRQQILSPALEKAYPQYWDRCKHEGIEGWMKYRLK